MTCPGQLYRYEQETYLDTRNAIVTKTAWVHLKQRSCKGCEHCHGYGPKDEARDADAESIDIQCKNPADGKIYRAEFIKDPLRGPDFVDEGDGHWTMIEVKS